MTTNNETEILTLPEVAALLRVSERTIQRWIAAHAMPCLRVGGTLRFDRAEVMAWARSPDRAAA